MKKGEAVSIVINHLRGGGTDFRESSLNPVVVGKYMESAISEMMAKYLEQNKNNIAPFLKAYDNVPVLNDEGRNQKYFDLPAPLMKFHRSLHDVSSMQDRSSSFVILQPGQEGLYSNLEVQDVMVFQEHGKGYFLNLPRGVKKVLVRMVPSIEGYDDDDELCIPLDMNDTLIRNTIELFGAHAQIPEDQVNDGRSQSR